jgi:lipopolysaccharide transport system ATP-binding protein
MKPILEIHHIGKQYKIRHLTGYLSLRERLAGAFRSKKEAIEDFWALKDVSFEVMPGESIGIIGRNGAGKSTLLKILSRITHPTKGKIISRGRIASLLEVGTGFHPELTGRENVFLNGSLLGMKKAEIRYKFDEIVDFSGTEKFLDTPLKHYSSGMQLRLAFSVAAFLEPEILVIDEVLAVGDMEFQKKCMGKMEEVTGSGRTIFFVSHNLAAVSRLCSKSIYLQDGEIIQFDSTDKVLDKYESVREQVQSSVNFDHPIVKKISIKLIDQNLLIEACLKNYTSNRPPFLGFLISDSKGIILCGTNPKMSAFSLSMAPTPDCIVSALIESPKFRDGLYFISVWIGDGQEDFFERRECVSIQIQNMIDSKYHPEISFGGPVFPVTKWGIYAS